MQTYARAKYEISKVLFLKYHHVVCNKKTKGVLLSADPKNDPKKDSAFHSTNPIPDIFFLRRDSLDLWLQAFLSQEIWN